MKYKFLCQLLVVVTLGMGLFLGAYPARGDEGMRLTFVSRRGEEFENVKVLRVEPDGLSLLLPTGIVKIPFEELPEELQKQFGMKSDRASQYRSQKAAAVREREDRLREMSRRAEAAAQHQADSTKKSSGSTGLQKSGQMTSPLEGQNALRAAKNYLQVMPFSQAKLIEQLKYDGFSQAAASYAASQCGADWNLQAKLAAKQYLTVMPFSRAGLISQLMYDGFTSSQAEYGVRAIGY